MKSIVHWRLPNAQMTACGRRKFGSNAVEDITKVTCKHCLAHFKRGGP